MQLALTKDEAALRDELREFYTTKIPAEIRERTRSGEGLDRDDIATSHKILNEHGLAVPHWPLEWGGKDWTPAQHQIWLDEMQLACVPEPLNFNAKMVGPVIAVPGLVIHSLITALPRKAQNNNLPHHRPQPAMRASRARLQGCSALRYSRARVA